MNNARIHNTPINNLEKPAKPWRTPSIKPERLAEIEFEIACHDELQSLQNDWLVHGVLTTEEARSKYFSIRDQYSARTGKNLRVLDTRQ